MGERFEMTPRGIVKVTPEPVIKTVADILAHAHALGASTEHVDVDLLTAHDALLPSSASRPTVHRRIYEILRRANPFLAAAYASEHPDAYAAED